MWRRVFAGLCMGLTLSYGTVGRAQAPAKRVLIDGVYYDRLEDGSMSVAKLYDMRNVHIKDSLNGLGAITQVGPKAATLLPLVEAVQLPRGITYIGDEAFAYCPSLRMVRVRTLTPPALGAHVFSHTDIGRCTLIVPRGTLAAYREADTWGRFGTIVEENGNKATRKGKKHE